MRTSHMERFWNDRARESALYFIDSRLDYRRPDEAAFWAGGEAALGQLLDAVGAPPLAPEHVALEIGCGIGRLTRPLAARVRHVHAIDVSEEMLARARQQNAALANVDWIHGDGTSLRPIGDSSVDVCLSHVVFRHIPEPRWVLGYVREMGRVLRTGGFAAFEFSNSPEPHVHRHRERTGRLLARLGRAPRGVTDAAWVGCSVALDELRGAAQDAGLQIARVVGEGTAFCGVLCTK